MRINEDMTLEEMEKAYLSDTAEQEFDRIVADCERERQSSMTISDNRRKIHKRKIVWTAGIAIAASLALFLILFPPKDGSPKANEQHDITTVEILQTINQLAAINAQKIEDITAKPSSKGIIITVQFNDGETAKYLMKRDLDTQGIELVAQNTDN